MKVYILMYGEQDRDNYSNPVIEVHSNQDEANARADALIRSQRIDCEVIEEEVIGA
jgi:hypothetical protein